jgi:hypothetical protein
MTNLSIGIISLVHAPVHVTDFSIVNVHVDELSSARIWQHKLCASFNMDWQILVFYPEPGARDIIY